jgi:hypothetical protein
VAPKEKIEIKNLNQPISYKTSSSLLKHIPFQSAFLANEMLMITFFRLAAARIDVVGVYIYALLLSIIFRGRFVS